jgi:hypothetical protein
LVLLLATIIGSAWSATEGQCVSTSISSAIVDAPAVLVLGARRGMQPDHLRAREVIRRLRRHSDVTLAVDVVTTQGEIWHKQHVANGFEDDALPLALRWDTEVSFPWSVYRPLLTNNKIDWVGIGSDNSEMPGPDEMIQVPIGIGDRIRSSSGGHDVPASRQDSLMRTIAWQEQRMAAAALEAWDGKGYLVVLADRFRVQGLGGLAWHFERQTSAPVDAYLLAWGLDRCAANDKVFTWLPFLPLPVVGEAG